MGPRKRRVAMAAALALLLAAYAGIGFVAVPGWIAAAARDACRERYGRELALGALHFNPFLLELEIEDLRLPDADGGDLLRWRRLDVEFEAFASLWRRGYVLRHIELDRPGVQLVLRPDGRWNAEDLLPPATPRPAKDASSTPPRLWIDRLAVRGGEAVVVDRAGPVEHVGKFTPVEFTLSGFSTATAGDRYELRARSPDLGGIEWRGTIDVNPLRSSGDFRFADVNLAQVAGWAEDRLPCLVTRGTLALAGRYDLSMRGTAPKLDAEISTVELTALALRARGESEDWVAIPRIAVSGAHLRWPAQQLHVDRISLERADVALALDAGLQPNLARLFLPPAAATPGESSAPAAPLLHWRLTPLDVAVTNLSWPATAPSQVDASVAIDGTGHIAVGGSLDLARRAVDLDLNASAIALAPLQPLLARSTALVLKSGAVGAQGKLSFDDETGTRFSGSLSSTALRVADPVVKEDLVRWQSLDLAGVQITERPLSIAVRDVVVREPYARLIIAPDGSTNLSDALARPGGKPGSQPAGKPGMQRAGKPGIRQADRPEAAGSGRDAVGPRGARAPHAASAPPQRPPAGLPIEIARVRVLDGSMNYADYTFQPHFATGILGLKGSISGLSGKPDARAVVQLDGAVDRYAPVTIRGQVNYLAANSFTDLDMTFQNIELTTFSPYSGKFAGYRIDRGKLSLDMNYHIADRRLEARHHVVISQLELGDRVASPEAVSIPVKLAVALLKDREGVIDLELPVTGSVDDPTFALGDVLWTVFRNLLVKAVTSPFALLGSLAGAGEGGELEFVEFAPGSAVLDPADLEKLGKLGQALAARPALQLDIPLVQTAEDAQVLADRPGELANLAKARADVVQQALIDDAGIDPGRIFVVNTVTETANPPPGGAPDRVRAQLLLH